MEVTADTTPSSMVYGNNGAGAVAVPRPVQIGGRWGEGHPACAPSRVRPPTTEQGWRRRAWRGQSEISWRRRRAIGDSDVVALAGGRPRVWVERFLLLLRLFLRHVLHLQHNGREGVGYLEWRLRGLGREALGMRRLRSWETEETRSGRGVCCVEVAMRAGGGVCEGRRTRT